MIITKHYLEPDPPSLADNTADIDRLTRELDRRGLGRNIFVDPADAGRYSRILRAADWRVTVSLAGDADGQVITGLEPGEATDSPGLEKAPLRPPMLPLPDLDSGLGQGYGLAIDLGTTGLVLELIDLADGRSLGTTALTNPQVVIGPDILTRIHHARGHGLARLQALVLEGLNSGAAELRHRAGLERNDIRAAAVAGNTTMTHLLLGLDPATICREPYIPVVNRPSPCPAAWLGLDINPRAPVICLPSIGSYFGGDLIAGLISSRLAADEAISILVDVGTNAEVVVGNRDWLMACAGAAGPALEGGVARMGKAAGPGAVERVRIDPDSLEPEIAVIGDAPPDGICGSGLIDLVAELYLAGVIDIQARIIPFDHPRIRVTEDGTSFILVRTGERDAERDIEFSQLDLDVLLRSKAAMFTILTTLLNQVGLRFEDLERFYVAGTFGQHIDPEQAIRIGMIPDLPRERYVSVGNSSLAGAARILISAGDRARAAGIRDRITYLELNVNQEFMNRFSAAKFMPHTERSLFPSVPEPHARPEKIMDDHR